MNTLEYTDKEKLFFQRTLRFIKDDDSIDHIPQPMFIVGRQGSGKTSFLSTLIELLRSRLCYEGEIISLDGKGFFTSSDIIRSIEGEDYDDNRLHHRESPSRRIVTIDDMDYFLQRSSFDDQYILRNYLNHNNAPLLIATISKVDDSLADYKAPFFEGIRLIYLPPFDKSIVNSLDMPETMRKRILLLLEYLPPVPRSLKIASEVVITSPCEKEDIKELLSRIAPSYKEKLGDLPTYAQMILYHLANSSKALSLSELRNLTGLTSGTLSPYLQRLVQLGTIEKIMSEKRGASYEICDPLFSLWLSNSHKQ